jgi:hypothetical protein
VRDEKELFIYLLQGKAPQTLNSYYLNFAHEPDGHNNRLTLGLPKNLMSIVVENAILVSFDVQHLTI